MHVFYACFLQPGQPRSKTETLEEVRKQVQISCLGVAQHVKDRQTSSGVKDAYTQYWIDHLIERARAMQKEHPERDHVSIQTELFNWAEQNKDKIYSGFLSLKGALQSYIVHFTSK